MKFTGKYTRTDLYMLILTLLYIYKINFPQKSPLDLIAFLIILMWGLTSFFRSLSD